jgi:hypothetical protein
VRAGVFLKTRVCKESSEGLVPLNTSKGDRVKSLCRSQVQAKGTFLFRRVIKEGTSGRNSLWRIPEITRTIGSREVAGWLKAGKLSTLGSRINVDR